MQQETEVRQKLGARIRRLREKRGWSQETFAHETGFARSFTSGIELGKKDVRLSTILKLSRIFGLSVSQLLKDLH